MRAAFVEATTKWRWRGKGREETEDEFSEEVEGWGVGAKEGR